MTTSNSEKPAIMWFRQDLRLTDNPALDAAVRGGRPVIPVFILDDETAGEWQMGGASRWWLDGSLRALSHSLEQLGSRLVLASGPAAERLMALAEATGAASIHCSRAYEPFAASLEQHLASDCKRRGIGFHRYAGTLLHEPEAVTTKTGEPYKVFTPYWSAARNLPLREAIARPASLAPPREWPDSDDLDEWQLRPSRPDWAGGLRKSWTPGEAGARERLIAFIDAALAGYADKRDRPDTEGTSMLSPHLHFGEISPLQCWRAVTMHAESRHGASGGAASFLRELGWREFSYQLLHHWPHIVDQPFKAQFEAFPWLAETAESRQLLQQWQRGQTGYPIVDAGMRQLWETGWMHNRVRMIVASFLTKHLRIHWLSGAKWFWDTLVDADLANNQASWQWVAGSGADAAPYFRIFNPILQGQKFDPDGGYVRRFVPELAALDARYVHAPWEAPHAALAAAGIRLGETYPEPIVDHSEARTAALDAYEAVKSTA